LRYFELIVFLFLTGNADMHLEKIALIQNKADFVLSPAYDPLFTRLILSEREDLEELALSVNGKKSKYLAICVASSTLELALPCLNRVDKEIWTIA